MPAFTIASSIYAGVAALTGIGGALASGAFSFILSRGLSLLGGSLFGKKPNIGVGGLPKTDTRTTAPAVPVQDRRWALGRVRTAGALVFFDEQTNDERTFWRAQVISEGPCEAIEKIWIDNEEVEFRREGNALIPLETSDFAGKFVLYEYFAADGSQGTELREACAAWTIDHKLDLLSWIALRFTQPDYGHDFDARFWSNPFPEVQVLVRGIKFAWPGQAEARWTENAAALRYWLEVNRARMPGSAFNRASFDAAYALAEQTVTVEPAPPDGYSNGLKRYTINGVLQASIDVDTIRAQADFAWQGQLADNGGQVYMLPGADRPVSAALGETDILQVLEVAPTRSIQNRINSATCSLNASRDHEWTGFDLPPVDDGLAVTRDGDFRLRSDLGELLFVDAPLAAARLVATALREARDSMTVRLQVRPGSNPDARNATYFNFHELLIGDYVTLTLPEYGFAAKLFSIQSIAVEDDMTLILDLAEKTLGAYADTLVLPPEHDRFLAIQTARHVPEVGNWAVASRAEVQSDGSLLVSLTMSWTRSAAPATEIQIRRAGTLLGTFTTAGTVFEYPGVKAGESYEARARHVNKAGIQGVWTNWAAHEVGGDLTPPATPTGLVATGLPGAWEVSWDAAPEADYKETEIWSAASTVTDVADAELLAKIVGTTFAKFGFESAATRNVWIRHVDRSGNLGGFARVAATVDAPIAGGQDGEDGTGVEYIFASSADGAAITGAANLPLATQNYDVDALRTSGGLARGTQRYFDGTPEDLSETRPYIIRFQRPVQGSPARNADIGAVPWRQERAVRAIGRGIQQVTRNSAGVVTIDYTDGATETFTIRDGVDGTTVQSITTADDESVTVTFTDGSQFTLPAGVDGTDGRDVSSITRNTSTGIVTVTLSDGSTQTFTIRDGMDGRDGSSQEWIYRATTTNTRPSRPASVNRNDYVPSGWSDNPVSGTYVWVSTRKKPAGTNTRWGTFSTPAPFRGAPAATQNITYMDQVAFVAGSPTDSTRSSSTPSLNINSPFTVSYSPRAADGSIAGKITYNLWNADTE